MDSEKQVWKVTLHIATASHMGRLKLDYVRQMLYRAGISLANASVKSAIFEVIDVEEVPNVSPH